MRNEARSGELLQCETSRIILFWNRVNRYYKPWSEFECLRMSKLRESNKKEISLKAISSKGFVETIGENFCRNIMTDIAKPWNASLGHHWNPSLGNQPFQCGTEHAVSVSMLLEISRSNEVRSKRAEYLMIIDCMPWYLYTTNMRKHH